MVFFYRSGRTSLPEEFRISTFWQGSIPVMKSPVCLLAVVLCACVTGCSEPAGTVAVEGQSNRDSTEPGAKRKFDFKPRGSAVTPNNSVREIAFPQFTDVAADVGIHHVFDNGASPKALMVESTGGGCGWGDFDRDGRIDLYLTQGGQPCPGPADAFVPDSL